MAIDSIDHTYNMSGADKLDYRHNSGVNTVYTDGHVEWTRIFSVPLANRNGVYFWGFGLGTYGTGYSL